MRQLEIQCEEASKTQPYESEKSAFYESCVAGGSSQIRAKERINQEQSTENNQPLPYSNEPIQPEEVSQESPVTLPEVTPTEIALPEVTQTEIALPTTSENSTETTSQSNQLPN